MTIAQSFFSAASRKASSYSSFASFSRRNSCSGVSHPEAPLIIGMRCVVEARMYSYGTPCAMIGSSRMTPGFSRASQR
jgi:hypothetical protein